MRRLNYATAIAIARPSGLDSQVRAMTVQARSHAQLPNQVVRIIVSLLIVAVLTLTPICLGAISSCEAQEKGSEQPSSVRNSAVFRGQVLQPDGEPAAVTSLYFSTYQRDRIPENTMRLVGTTDLMGHFEIRNASELIDKTYSAYVTLVAFKQGFGVVKMPAMAFEVTGYSSPQIEENLRSIREQYGAQRIIQLTEDVPLSGRILTSEGKPVVNGKVKVLSTSVGKPNLDKWEEAATMEKADSYMLRQLLTYESSGAFLPTLVNEVTTDQEGKFTIQGLGTEKVVDLLLSGPNVASTTLQARTRLGKTVRVPSQHGSTGLPDVVIYPAAFDFVMATSSPVKGRIIDVVTNQPLVGCLVTAGRRFSHTVVGNLHVETVTEGDGRFHLEGLSAASQQTLYVVPPKGTDYLPVGASFESPTIGKVTTQNFELRTGVRVHGVVTDTTTGLPIRGSIQYFAHVNNKHLNDYVGFKVSFLHECRTDQNGNYEIAVLPGVGVLTFRADDWSKYELIQTKSTRDNQETMKNVDAIESYLSFPTVVNLTNYQFAKHLDIDPNTQQHELSFGLASGVSIEAHVKMPNGQFGRKALIKGSSDQPGWRHTSSELVTVDGYFPNRGRELFVYDPESNHVGFVRLAGSRNKKITIELKPSSVIRG